MRCSLKTVSPGARQPDFNTKSLGSTHSLIGTWCMVSYQPLWRLGCHHLSYLHGTQADSIHSLVPQPHKQGCGRLFPCLLKVFPKPSNSEAKHFLITTTACIRSLSSPSACWNMDFLFLCDKGWTWRLSFVTFTSFSSCSFSDSSYWSQALGSQYGLYSTDLICTLFPCIPTTVWNSKPLHLILPFSAFLMSYFPNVMMRQYEQASL